MKISNLSLPDHVQFFAFDDRETLANELANLLAAQLIKDIENDGQASLAVSGGSTPIPLFHALSQKELNWEKVTVSLVDDRWVGPADSASNEQLVKKHLLTSKAEAAEFIGFWQPNTTPDNAISDCQSRVASLPKILSSVVLGMGNDGHTASVFPCSEEIDEALISQNDCMVVTPTTAPYKRITLTPNRLMNSHQRILHICGPDKLETLTAALSGSDQKEMPIRYFLNHPLTIFWSP